MTIEFGTSELFDSWAASGTKVEPSAPETLAGFSPADRPAAQSFNWLFNNFSNKINYLLRSGVPEWISSTNYLLGDLCSYNGTLWISTSGNINSEPPSSNWTSISGSISISNDTSPQLGGDLDVNGNSIVSASDGNIPITPDGTGRIILDGLSWPSTDGSATTFLTTDGSGSLSFVTIPFAGLNNSAIATQVNAEAGTANDKLMTPLRTKQAIDELALSDVTLGATGQEIHPSGLIRKWGKLTGVTSATPVSVTFSTAFPNDIRGIQITQLGVRSGGAEANHSIISDSNVGFTLSSGSAGSHDFYWQAIGE